MGMCDMARVSMWVAEPLRRVCADSLSLPLLQVSLAAALAPVLALVLV